MSSSRNKDKQANYQSRNNAWYRSFQAACKPSNTTLYPPNFPLYVGYLSEVCGNHSETDFPAHFLKTYWRPLIQALPDHVRSLRQAAHDSVHINGYRFNADIKWADDKYINKNNTLCLSINQIKRNDIPKPPKSQSLKAGGDITVYDELLQVAEEDSDDSDSRGKKSTKVGGQSTVKSTQKVQPKTASSKGKGKAKSAAPLVPNNKKRKSQVEEEAEEDPEVSGQNILADNPKNAKRKRANENHRDKPQTLFQSILPRFRVDVLDEYQDSKGAIHSWDGGEIHEWSGWSFRPAIFFRYFRDQYQSNTEDDMSLKKAISFSSEASLMSIVSDIVKERSPDMPVVERYHHILQHFQKMDGDNIPAITKCDGPADIAWIQSDQEKADDIDFEDELQGDIEYITIDSSDSEEDLEERTKGYTKGHVKEAGEDAVEASSTSA